MMFLQPLLIGQQQISELAMIENATNLTLRHVLIPQEEEEELRELP